MNIFEIIKVQQKINELKGKLRATDYKAIKFAEGEISAEEYETTKLLRKGWRSEINLLELQIEALKKT